MASKNSTKTATGKVVPGPFVLRVKRNLYYKMKILKQLVYIEI